MGQDPKQKLQNLGRVLKLRGQKPSLLILVRARTFQDQVRTLVLLDLKQKLQNRGRILMLRGQTPRLLSLERAQTLKDQTQKLRSQASALMLQNKNLRVWNKHCFRTGIQVYNNWDRRRYMYFEIASASSAEPVT